MKKGLSFFAALCLVMIVASGCGQHTDTGTIARTTVVIKDDGTVTYHLVGEFDRDYYSLDELTAMAKEEAAQFNAAQNTADSAPSVTVEGREYRTEEGHQVVMTYQFDGVESFAGFTKGFWYSGTLKDAAAQGCLDGVELKSVKDGSTLTEEQMKKQGKARLIITDIHAVIYFPSGVVGVSEGVVPEKDKAADASRTEGKAYILLAK
ncbi:MAG: hypothetical protein ACI4HQ_01270 [Acetatifactor sp.]